MVDWIFQALNNTWNYIMDGLKVAAMTLLQSLLGTLPSGWQTSAETVRTWLEIANAWLPLDYMFDLLIAYLAWELIWAAGKAALSMMGVKLS
ncbi:MAG: hypothetical protein K8T91_12955 [Planctomycetes bacterium]|nr:hypothetical protein [Planctomycetota bacterium]